MNGGRVSTIRGGSQRCALGPLGFFMSDKPTPEDEKKLKALLEELRVLLAKYPDCGLVADILINCPDGKNINTHLSFNITKLQKVDLKDATIKKAFS